VVIIHHKREFANVPHLNAGEFLVVLGVPIFELCKGVHDNPNTVVFLGLQHSTSHGVEAGGPRVKVKRDIVWERTRDDKRKRRIRRKRLVLGVVDGLSNAKSEDGHGVVNRGGDVECGREIPWKHYVQNHSMRRVLLQKGFYLGFEVLCGLPYLVRGSVVFCR